MKNKIQHRINSLARLIGIIRDNDSTIRTVLSLFLNELQFTEITIYNSRKRRRERERKKMRKTSYNSIKIQQKMDTLTRIHGITRDNNFNTRRAFYPPLIE